MVNEERVELKNAGFFKDKASPATIRKKLRKRRQLGNK